MSLNSSDIIQLLGIIVSLLTSLIAIAISVKTLMQNAKMIEGSTRPYIGIYGAGVYAHNPKYYLVIKNFGQSSAHITAFLSDFDLAQCVYHECPEPFLHIENSTLMPGQSFQSVIDLKKTLQKTNSINFHLCYSSGTHKYEDDILLNLQATTTNYVQFSSTKGKELSIISETLQDIHVHNL